VSTSRIPSVTFTKGSIPYLRLKSCRKSYRGCLISFSRLIGFDQCSMVVSRHGYADTGRLNPPGGRGNQMLDPGIERLQERSSSQLLCLANCEVAPGMIRFKVKRTALTRTPAKTLGCALRVIARSCRLASGVLRTTTSMFSMSERETDKRDKIKASAIIQNTESTNIVDSEDSGSN
jgi:hypothetical protein